MKINFFTMLVVLFFGCQGFSIRNIGKGPLSNYEIWSMSHQSKLEVQKALLECGYPNSYSFDFNPPNIKADMNAYILAKRCMLKAGFIQMEHYQDNLQNRLCNKKYHDYPACDLLWDEIPDRNITKRLESDYCKHKIYRTYPDCQP